MKFVVSSTDLLSHLAAISKVISSKSTMPILDNFLFQLTETELSITASDLESTLITSMELDNIEGEGTIAVPAKLITDTLKEFPEQPLTFQIDNDSFAIEIFSDNGKFSIVGQNAEDFPELPVKDDESVSSVNVSHKVLQKGIDKTLFATADDELRPVMNGIFVEITPDFMSFVASDAHKLVRYRRTDAKADFESSFILPKKPAGLLKNLLPKEEFDVKLEFDDKNAFFTLSNYKLICRLVEGNYPSYNSVIPTDNPNSMIIDRIAIFNTVKRVSVFSNQASNLVKLNINENQLVVSAQDIDFSISAVERLNCEYEGDEIEIGFKSTFLQEILSNISSGDVKVELSDPTRAGLLLPAETDDEDEDVLMLLMPMMINA
ncbi:MAG: DNA polymerase III subunit beta [Prolixibacteraceae bacterium]|jgi:DNA polymerase III subunit beta|nr:DNA polymerase III subunit beta [Prolixibacteraceae bacterium]MBT6005623.1 DNA polymerase III subunit beta [Prolixibacteraceae bacterium]MBT6766303.1 DNA polymerase III subunit beta [Prolixibacteraceae bacterium]MBT6999260.1 DNA polymerase III subunit beta [Prolixibacteraceae bacterium]MBT7394960.1 DNA polymerase III subunit beta [Prolixibacteraceae bacterium]